MLIEVELRGIVFPIDIQLTAILDIEQSIHNSFRNMIFICLMRTSILMLLLCLDNLAANFSRELADYIIYIIDVSGGDKIPRKGGPGITQADLLVCSLDIFCFHLEKWGMELLVSCELFCM